MGCNEELFAVSHISVFWVQYWNESLLHLLFTRRNVKPCSRLEYVHVTVKNLRWALSWNALWKCLKWHIPFGELCYFVICHETWTLINIYTKREAYLYISILSVSMVRALGHLYISVIYFYFILQRKYEQIWNFCNS